MSLGLEVLPQQEREQLGAEAGPSLRLCLDSARLTLRGRVTIG